MAGFQSFKNGCKSWLQHRHLPWHLALLGVLLCAPALDLGLLLDDLFHCASLTRPDLPMINHDPWDLFSFIQGDEPTNRLYISLGILPWWSHEGLRIAFFRPLTSFTHWLDYQLWPDLPWLMHLQSLIWFAAVILAATFFYRRLLGMGWLAGMAALLFALDDSHGLPAVWLANRNALVSLLFGLFCLILHDRWRQGKGWWVALLAPLMFLCSLLAKESAMAVGAYLFAYALFLDRGRWFTRLGSLIPCGLIGLCWCLYYTHHGYGTAGSGWYINPLTDLSGFLQALASRAPTLLAWQWLVPTSFEWELSPGSAQILWLAVMAGLLLLAVLLVPLLRKDRLARFFAMGMLLSLIPACTAYPYSRLLIFAGLGGMGLLAQLIAALPANRSARSLAYLLLFLHLLLAPVILNRTVSVLDEVSRAMARAEASFPSDRAARAQTVLIVRAPNYSALPYTTLSRVLKGEKLLGRGLVLGSGCNPMEISRPDAKTLVLRPEGGFFAVPGSGLPDPEAQRLLVDHRAAWLSLDRLYRDRSPMIPGQRIQVFGAEVEILEVMEDGRPAAAAFHFLTGLENPFFRWIVWEDGEFVPFNLPAVGERVRLDGMRFPF